MACTRPAGDAQPEPLPNLSRVGLGAWAFGGVGWGPQEDRDSIAAIHRAVERGVNWIDTAAVYGGGHAELVVGEAISGLPEPERPLVFTKAGIRLDPRTGATYRDLSPASLRAECEESLRRLGVERLDLYQLHWPVEQTAVVDAAWRTLDELQREGKIRWAGASNFDRDLLERCSNVRSIDLLQYPLSLIDRSAVEDILPWASASGVPLIVYSPLGSGLLSGRFSADRLASLPPDDWRRRRPQFQAPLLQRTLRLVEQLQAIAESLGMSLVELAVAWTLQWSAVAGAIVGARSPEQVDGWINAGDLRLGTDTLERIETALRTTEAGIGSTSRP